MHREITRGPRPKDVYFFATCLVDLFCPEAGMDAIELLEREGIAVHFPENQTCCGQPAYTSGYADEARAVAKVQMELFPEDWPIVVRLKNLQFGYTFQAELLKSIGLNKLRVFVNGSNLFSVDKFWDGYDVEAPVGYGNFYPQVKVYSFGLDITL